MRGAAHFRTIVSSAAVSRCGAAFFLAPFPPNPSPAKGEWLEAG